MATQTRYPTTAGAGLTNPTNAYADDGTAATGAPAKNGTIESIYGGFGFDALIPAGSTINSVTWGGQRWYSTAASIASCRVQALVGGTRQTAHTDTNEPTSEGSSSPPSTISIALTGDRSWTRADLLDAAFTVAFAFLRGNSTTSFTGSLDYHSVTVDYTPPPTPVGHSAGATWNTRQAAGGSADETWNVLANATAVGRSAAAMFGLLAVVGASAGAGWATRQTAGHTAASTFGVRTAAGRTASAGFDLRGTAGHTAAAIWSTRQLAGRAGSAAFGVKALAGRAATAGWGLRELAGQTAGATYGVRGTAGASATATLRLRQLAGALVGTTWTLAGGVGRSASGSWGIGGAVGRAVAAAFGIRGVVARPSTAGFAIRGLAGESAPAVFALGGSVGSTAGAGFEIGGKAFLPNIPVITSRSCDPDIEDEDPPEPAMSARARNPNMKG